jgi:hypothetical protein
LNKLLAYSLIFIILTFSIYGKDNSFIEKLEFIRTNYYASVEDEDIIEKVEEFINNNFSQEDDKCPPVITAYKAALKSVRSKHAFWPVSKLNYFNESMALFEEAVRQDPNNLEIRFLRFTILHYVPSFLGHSSERNSDMLVIIHELAKKDYTMIKPDIQKGIAEFLLRSERLKPEQEKKLYSYYPEAKP